MGRTTDEDLNAFQTEEICLRPRESTRPDGEVTMIDAPLHYSRYPQALRVLIAAREMERGNKA
jgi:hypothetical protein